MTRLTRKGAMASVTENSKRGNAGRIGIRRYRDKDIIDAKMGIDEQAFLPLRGRKAFGEDWGTSKRPAPSRDCEASGFRSIRSPDQSDNERRPEFGSQTKEKPASPTPAGSRRQNEI